MPLGSLSSWRELCFTRPQSALILESQWETYCTILGYFRGGGLVSFGSCWRCERWAISPVLKLASVQKNETTQPKAKRSCIMTLHSLLHGPRPVEIFTGFTLEVWSYWHTMTYSILKQILVASELSCHRIVAGNGFHYAQFGKVSPKTGVVWPRDNIYIYIYILYMITWSYGILSHIYIYIYTFTSFHIYMSSHWGKTSDEGPIATHNSLCRVIGS